MASPSDDHGSISVAGIALVVAALSLLLLAGSVGGWATARAKAAMVADLAALAAARSGGCASANDVAVGHGAMLDECVQIDGDVIVTVTVPHGGALSPVVSQRARSGY